MQILYLKKGTDLLRQTPCLQHFQAESRSLTKDFAKDSQDPKSYKLSNPLRIFFKNLI